MKNRILFSNIVIVIAILFSKPDSFILFFIGSFFVILGELVRIIASFTISKSKELTTKGIYCLSRNPLYLGTFIIFFGVLIQLTSINHLFISFMLCFFTGFIFLFIYYKTIKYEEDFLVMKFKNNYTEYRKCVPCLIPRFKRFKEIFKKDNYSFERGIKNKEWRSFFGIIVVEVLVLIKIIYKI